MSERTPPSTIEASSSVPRGAPPHVLTWKARPVFFSSTFRDMHAERDWLRTHAFMTVADQLRERCHDLDTIDLRQGVETVEEADEAAREMQVLKVCLEEIDRSRPFVVVLLGERYGWTPPDERIIAAARAAGLPESVSVSGKSVTELEILHGVLENPGQKRRSWFYFRKLDLTGMPPEVAERFPAEAPSTDPASPAAKLRALKERIQRELPDRVREYTLSWDPEKQALAGLEELDALVTGDLWSDLDAETAEYLRKAPRTWQEADALAVADFVAQRVRGFVDRPAVSEPMREHALSTASTSADWGLVVTGESGSGKSSLFMRAVGELAPPDDKGELLLLSHAAGIFPSSGQVDRMLRRWITELAAHLDIPDPIASAEAVVGDPGTQRRMDEAPKFTSEDIDKAFADLLGRASVRRRVIVLIDALNQFEPTVRASHVTWLPKIWPPNARLIATAIPGSASQAVKARPGCRELPVPPVTRAEAQDIARQYYRERYHRAVNPAVLGTLFDKRLPDGRSAFGNPLWLTIALQEMNLLEADDFERAEREYACLPGAERMQALQQHQAARLPADVHGVYAELLARAERAFGVAWAQAFMGLIAVSRAGWRESDLRELMPRLSGRAWDALAFAGVRRALGPHVMQRGAHAEWDFFHTALRETVLRRDHRSEAERRSLHGLIVDHLLGLPPSDPVRISESMVHLLGLGDHDRAAEYLAALKVTSSLPPEPARGFGELTREEFGSFAVPSTAGDPPPLVGRPPQFDSSGSSPPAFGARADSLSRRNGERMLRGTTLPQRGADVSRHDEGRVAGSDGPWRWVFGFTAAARERPQPMPPWAARMPNAPRSAGGSVTWARATQAATPPRASAQSVADAKGGLEGAVAVLVEAVREAPDGAELDRLTNWIASLMLGEDSNAGPVAMAVVLDLNSGLMVTGDARSQDVRHRLVDTARATFSHLSVTEPWMPAWPLGLSLSHNIVGDLLRSRGDLAGANETYREAFAAAERAATTDPSNPEPLRQLAVSGTNVGCALALLGDQSGALHVFRESLDLAERVAHADPAHSREWLAIVSRCEALIGEALSAQADKAGALGRARDSLRGLETLAAVEPANLDVQHEVALIHGVIGDLLRDGGDECLAIKAHDNALSIAQRLVDSDPTHADWQRDMAVLQERVGRGLQARGDLAGALQAYRQCQAAAQRLADSDPSNTDWQRDLAASGAEVGDLLREQGDAAGALEAYRESERVTQLLVHTDSSHAHWQRDLAVCRGKIGDVLHDQRDLAGALQAYQDALEVLQRLADVDRSNAVLGRDVSVCWQKIGEVRREQSDLPGALAAYREALALAERLVANDRTNTVWAEEVSTCQANINELLIKQVRTMHIRGEELLAGGDPAGALRAYRESRANMGLLAQGDPSNLQLQCLMRDMDGLIARLARLQPTPGRGQLPPPHVHILTAPDVSDVLLGDATATPDESTLNALFAEGGELFSRGDLAGALVPWRQYQACVRRRAEAEPSSAIRQRELAQINSLIATLTGGEAAPPVATRVSPAVPDDARAEESADDESDLEDEDDAEFEEAIRVLHQRGARESSSRDPAKAGPPIRGNPLAARPAATSTLKNRLRCLGASLIGLALSAFLFFWNIDLVWCYFGSGYERTTATVIHSTATQGRTPNADYSFEIHGRRYKGSGQVKSVDTGFMEYTVSRSMEVYYDPRNPSRNYSAYRSLACRFFWGPLLIFAIVPLLVLGSLALFVAGSVLGKPLLADDR